MTNLNNIILLTDSYKVSHHLQYPAGTQTIYSYFESRQDNTDITFFGLQYFLKHYLVGVQVTPEKIDLAEKIWNKHFAQKVFNREGWEYIVSQYGGKLPVTIKAVPEGTVVNGKNVLMTIENTDPKCFWLTNYLETLLVQVWYPSTVSSYSRECKKMIRDALVYTGCENVDEQLAFKLHDFGFRGVSSVETAALGGAAHLVNFMGTDTTAGLILAMEYYNSDVCGYSIPAAEHSTITSWGKENEGKAFENMVNQFGSGLFAVVSDSYNIYNACENLWGKELKEKILTMKGNLVVRPDSGYPPDVVCEVLNILYKQFGGTVNKRGFKVLNPKVRVIQGDGIDKEMLSSILGTMKIHMWAAENVAFGSGGGLLQKHNRDTFKFAFKCSAALINDEWIDVFKAPITDAGKNSKKGRLALVRTANGYETVQEADLNGRDNVLVEVFRNGELLKDYTFEEIRARV